jgi:hypothetical protein
LFTAIARRSVALALRYIGGFGKGRCQPVFGGAISCCVPRPLLRMRCTITLRSDHGVCGALHPCQKDLVKEEANISLVYTVCYREVEASRESISGESQLVASERHGLLRECIFTACNFCRELAHHLQEWFEPTENI